MRPTVIGSHHPDSTLVDAASAQPVVVPLGGNAFITRAAGGIELINDTGLHNWTSNAAVISVYFYVQQAGDLQLALVGSLTGQQPGQPGQSKVKVTIGDQWQMANLATSSTGPFDAGGFKVSTVGYIKVDLQGLFTDCVYYGDISGLQIGGSATMAGTAYANDASNFYWSRRGPSVHLDFSAPSDTEYWYSELNVLPGQDPIGSYFMANGFSVGYFGIQVNSATERRVLFSVWDPPGGNTTLERKGADVIAGKFGNEGNGGQSYLVYPWTAGRTYRFLTRAQFDQIDTDHTDTLFTSWFADGASPDDWKLIATWRYSGGTRTYLSELSSFQECFDKESGWIGREAIYGNQWARSAGGGWTELISAKYTVDSTGLNRQRLDFAGGTAGNAFYLHNDGFFTPSVASGQTFTRGANGTPPNVDLKALR